MLIGQKFIKFDKKLANWINSLPLDLIDERDRLKIERIDSFIPLDVEGKIRQTLKTRIDEDCKILLRKLLNSCNGISLRSLGANLQQAGENKFCASSILVELGLARRDESEQTLKALPIAFDENVQYLIGIGNIY